MDMPLNVGPIEVARARGGGEMVQSLGRRRRILKNGGCDRTKPDHSCHEHKATRVHGWAGSQLPKRILRNPCESRRISRKKQLKGRVSQHEVCMHLPKEDQQLNGRRRVACKCPFDPDIPAPVEHHGNPVVNGRVPGNLPSNLQRILREKKEFSDRCVRIRRAAQAVTVHVETRILPEYRAWMSRELLFAWRGDSVAFDHQRIERRQLYGAKRRIAIDAAGNPCTRVSMTMDGVTVLRPGMTAQGWFTEEGEQVESSEVVAVGTDGDPLALHPSTVGVEQQLEGPVKAIDVLDLAVEAVLLLTPRNLPEDLRAALDQGQVFRFTYCYRPDPMPSTGFLMSNQQGIFALIGRTTQLPWMTREQAGDESAANAEDDGDVDFDMV